MSRLVDPGHVGSGDGECRGAFSEDIRDSADDLTSSRGVRAFCGDVFDCARCLGQNGQRLASEPWIHVAVEQKTGNSIDG